MPSSCCAVGCTSRYSKQKGVKLFRFPQDKERLKKWIQAIKRQDWEPNKYSRVCGSHFVSGKPSADKSSPDYVPSIFVYSRKSDPSKLSRYQRLVNRRSVVEVTQPATSESNSDDATFDNNKSTNTDVVETESRSTMCDINPKITKFTSTDLRLKDIKKLEDLVVRNEVLEKRILVLSSPVARMTNNDEMTHFFTGLPSYAVFNALLSKLGPLVASLGSVGSGLSIGDEFLLVLSKLARFSTNQDLAYRFNTHVTKVTTIFHRWIDIMAENLKTLIVWPSKEMIISTLPECFKRSKYHRTTCIIDCSETFIERPTSLVARVQTYSNYKSHNTVKYLVVISPTGAVIFLSKCWGGRVSDKHITSHSGFLNHIDYNDVVMADRGFDIADELALCGASLAIPPFTKGKPQLSQREVETARAISNVRIHVERAIGRIKNYKILHSTVPITLIKRPHETELATIDKILISCSALSNLQPPLVS